jgi:redox-sensitive bicupin YhaK (pirin superfamily)
VIFAAFGTAAADGTDLAPGSLLYLPPGRETVVLAARAGARLFLLGGEPLREALLMWWNFVGRTPGDIAAAARDWAAGERFGTVTGYRGAPLPAPPLDVALLARKAR